MTTAAGLLATAAVGVACGLHLYVLASGATLLFLFTLGWLGLLVGEPQRKPRDIDPPADQASP
ncbi:MAG: hypothetical protein AB1511_04685 [Deinococcota bacterium]